MAATQGSEESRSAKWGGWFGIVTGIVYIVTLVVIGLYVSVESASVDQLLANYGTYSNTLIIAQVVFGLQGVVGVPFAIALRNGLKWKDNTLSSAAAIFFIVGPLVLTVFDQVAFSGLAYLADLYATGGQNQASLVAAATAVLLMPHGSSILAVAFASVGLLLFGVAMVNSKTYPNWVAGAAVVSGLAGLLATGMAIAGSLALLPVLSGLRLVFSVAEFVWVFASAGYLLRSAKGGRATVATMPT